MAANGTASKSAGRREALSGPERLGAAFNGRSLRKLLVAVSRCINFVVFGLLG